LIVELISQKKYDEEMELLNKIEESEKKGGKFIAKEGDIDSRSDELIDITLNPGFKT